jgi:hypothetical protein
MFHDEDHIRVSVVQAIAVACVSLAMLHDDDDDDDDACRLEKHANPTFD